MKIGYDAKRAFCNNTGLGNYSRMLVRGAAEGSPESTFVLYTPRTKGRHEGWCNDLQNVEVRHPAILPSLWRTFLGLRLRRDGIQIYHGLSHELPLLIPHQVKSIVTMHDLIVRRYPHYYHWIDRVIHRLKQRHACRRADLIVAISEQTRRDLVDLMHVPDSKIRVIYQTCDPIFWKEEGLETKDDKTREKYGLPERYILCVGTVEERKNQVAAVRALAQLPADVALVIVGRPRGRYPQQVRRTAHECGVDNRVIYLDNASFADFPQLYAGAVASVYMSRFEGFGIPVLESLCCDTPVVTSNLSSMPEAGGDAALYAAPDDIDTIAAHLNRLLSDPAFRQQCIEKGRIQRLRFAPDHIAAQWIALYKALLQ